MKKYILPFILVLSFTTASADTISLDGEIGLNSNYVWRGVEQTDGHSTLQAGLEAGVFDIFYIGAWGTSSELVGQIYEVNFFGGVKLPLSKETDLDIGAIYYEYPNINTGSPDFYEVYVGLEHTYHNTGIVPTIGAKVYYSPELGGNTGESLYYNIYATVLTPNGFDYNIGLGYTDFEDSVNTNDDYSDFNVGLGYTFTPNVHAGFYYATTGFNTEDPTDDALGFDLKYTF